MAVTGDSYVSITDKRLMDNDHFKENFFDYLRELFQVSILLTWTKGGTFGSTRVTISASVNDEFDLDSYIGTDGAGHFLEPGSTYEQNVQFENTDTIIYDIAMRYDEKPDGVQNNPRTSQPEYLRWEEVVGHADTPAAVVTDGGSGVKVTLPDSMCDNDRTHVGRKALVWKVTPLTQEEAVAVQELTVYFEGGVNKVTVPDFLGGTTLDTTASNYRVLLLGPTVTRQSETPLVAASGYWYAGEIEGDGAGNPPINPDNANQRLIEKSLSDLLENLVYDNVANTFTKKQTIVSDSGVGLDATGDGINAGVLGKGGATDGPGVVGQGGGTNGSGMSAEGTGTGVGLDCSSSGTRSPIKLTPRTTPTTGTVNGDAYQNSADPFKVQHRVNGEWRTIAEKKSSTRKFYLPLTSGAPGSENADNQDWKWRGGSVHKWISKAVNDALEVTFDINRFVPHGATIKKVRAYVDPGATESGVSRMMMIIGRVNADGSGYVASSTTYYPSEVVHTPDWIDSGTVSLAIASDTYQHFVSVRKALNASADELLSIEITYEENEYLRIP